MQNKQKNKRSGGNMITRERLLAITNLNFSNISENISQRELEDYEKRANTFIDKLPGYENTLRESLANGEHGYFQKILTDIQKVLLDLYATELAENGNKVMSDIKSSEKKAAEASLTLFLSNLSMLSIDLQMAQHPNIEEKTPAVTAERAIVPPPQRQEPLILAVDDVPLILNHLKYIFSDSPYRFVSFTTGKAALKYLLTNDPPDLFILDIEMPSMSGFELAEKIKERNISAPIIFLTGYAPRANVIKAINCGVKEFLIKPFNEKLVLFRIERLLKKSLS
jgi:CheY-like chemotaxis protein